jgi:hypothetical protein
MAHDQEKSTRRIARDLNVSDNALNVSFDDGAGTWWHLDAAAELAHGCHVRRKLRSDLQLRRKLSEAAQSPLLLDNTASIYRL